MIKLDSGPEDTPVALINLFSVPPEESGQFQRRWRDNARIMSAQTGFIRASLHRALSDGVEFRFINVAQWASGIAVDRARTSPAFRSSAQRMADDPQLRVIGRAAVYEIAVELRPGEHGCEEGHDQDGLNPETAKTGTLDSGPDALIAGPITLINPFTVPLEETDRFLRYWRRSARIMAAQRGFVAARLHRAVDKGAQFRFINVAQWASGTAFDRARTNPDFQSEGQRMLADADLHVTGVPAPYQIVIDVTGSADRQAGSVHQ